MKLCGSNPCGLDKQGAGQTKGQASGKWRQSCGHSMKLQINLDVKGEVILSVEECDRCWLSLICYPLIVTLSDFALL